MRVVAIIQARMGSTRLPGKVLLALGGQTVLAHVIARVQAAPVADIVVATTVCPSDDVVVEEAKRCGARWFRGSEDDVLARYHLAAQQSGARVVLRVTADCPLLDPGVLGTLIETFVAQLGAGVDYASNTLQRTYPRGLDAEVFTAAALETAFLQATKPHEREHVTPYLYQHPELFRLYHLVNDVDLSHHRWTLDTLEDFQLLDAIFRALAGGPITTQRVLAYLDRHPELVRLNAHVAQKKLEANG
ncbi:MAG: glycosyltransferase family protein [Cyanobacteria bacterium NC_groundwater_1444_Ag_S-0.65um_54_12]|nr:glycosyltransferase family protein [Cyanobacteria bacterium NC_groundwater_1444_Ag_S-0.65um_54_12]